MMSVKTNVPSPRRERVRACPVLDTGVRAVLWPGRLCSARNGVVINAPPPCVFDYLADMTRHGEWNPEDGFRVIFQPEGQPGGRLDIQPGAHRRLSGAVGYPPPAPGPASSVTVTLTTAITVYQPHGALTFETRASYNGLLYSIERTSFELQPIPGGRMGYEGV